MGLADQAGAFGHLRWDKRPLQQSVTAGSGLPGKCFRLADLALPILGCIDI
jgi:hypothetical protein